MSAPIWLSRVTEGMRFSEAHQSLLDVLRALQEKQRALSTGKKVSIPSENPLGATRILNLRLLLRRTEEYEKNLAEAKRRLGHFDVVLEDLENIVDRAREILMSQMGDNATAETRRNASLEVANLVEEALRLVNRKFSGRYIFGGLATDRRPFVAVGNYIAFQGTLDEWLLPVGPDVLFGSSISSREALGARSAEILGREDLTPVLREETRLVDLNRGEGVRLGEILISDGLGHEAKVDLTGCVDLRDVLRRINETGVVTATIRPDGRGLRLTAPAGANITVSEVADGHTAQDLGILVSGGGETVNGTELNPVLTLDTPLSDLRLGQGLDSSGFTIQNGEISVSVDLSGLETVGDLLHAINNSGAYVHAELNSSRTGINLVSVLNGAELKITEGSGVSASQLGLLLEPADIPLEQLNRGFGVQSQFGPDFKVKLHDGSEIAIDISECETLGEVVALINEKGGGKITAEFGPGVSLRLIDHTKGGSGFAVLPEAGSQAASQLGIEGQTSGEVIEGEDLNPAGVRVDGLFNALVMLRDGLAQNDQPLLTRIGDILDRAQDLLLDARADVGGRINRLEIAQDRSAQEKLFLQEALSDEEDVDLAEAILAFQQEELRLQAALGVTGMVLQHSLLDFLR